MDKRLFTVIKKELKRVFSDRRLVFSTMILPALSIFLMYSIMGNMITDMEDDIMENVADVVIVNAPISLVNYIEEKALNDTYNFKYDTSTSNYKEKILEGELEVLLVFDKSFDKEVIDYLNPQIERYYNRSEEYSSEAKWNIDELLREYEEYLLGERIGSQEHVNVFSINEDGNLEDGKKATGKTLGVLFPMLIAIFLFTGAMSVGADIIAGEKERGTMATLLVTPVNRGILAMGKIIALAIIAIISAFSSFVGILASLPAVGTMFSNDGVNIADLQFGLMELLSLGLIMLSLVSLYVAMVCIVSIIAKSVKEANTYMAPIYMIVMMSGFTTMYSDGLVDTWRFAIPIYGSIIALKNLFAFELTSTMLLYTCASSLIITGVAMYLIKELFNNERVMFNK